MSDADQRRSGLAERRDSFVQDAETQTRRDASAHDRARQGARRAVPARDHEDPRAPVSQVGGEMIERIRAHDWESTPLGAMEQWPPCLRNFLQTILRSPVPMSISWGERGILLYNDAMIPVLGIHHPQALGVSALEVWPEHADWNERVLRRVLAGESVSLHNERMETRRSGVREQSWFDLDYSPIVDEDGQPGGMLSVVVETTAQVAALAERERLEANLRESDARHRFVLAFNDRVRGLSDPGTVLIEAVTALGEHLQAARCGYAEVRLEKQQLEVEAEWTDERQASALGMQSLAGASEAVRATFLAGKTFVVRDAQNDAREAVRERADRYLEWGARALIGVPLIHQGRWVGLLYIADARPRAWAPAEIGLIEEMAARIWEAVERARAESALRENEARLRALFEAVPSAVFVSDRDGVIQAYNARAVELWGRAPLRGIDKRGAVQAWSVDGQELTQSPIQEVLETGRSLQVELTIGRPDGVRLPVVADYSPLKNTHGEITGAIVAFNDISERKRRESELALLADIGEATAHCDDEAQIMQAVSPRIASHMGLHCCCLISVDAAHQNAVVDQVWYEGAIPDLPRRAALSAFVVPAFTEEARSGRPIVVNDCHADPRTDGEAYARYEVASYISLPWHEDGEWRGLLAFCDDQPRAWSGQEVELARELASRIMPRLQRARAQAALRESQQRLAAQVSDLERLHALGTRLMKQDDLDSVLREVMHAARELLHADKATVQICEQGRLRVISAIGFPDDYIDKFHIVAADGITTCAAALRARERVVVEDLKHDPRFNELADASPGLNLRGAVSTPLLGGDGSVVAMFTLYFERPWRGNEHALRMLDLYAQQAMVQVGRVRRGRDAAWLAAIVASSHDAIISKDLNGVINSWNKGAEWLFGYTAEEAIGRSITMLIPPERIDEETDILSRIRAGEIVDHFETVRVRKDGTQLDVSLTIAPIRDAQGRILGASKIARDITARKRAERDAARLAAIIMSTHDAVYSADMNGTISTWNHGAELLLGYTAEETVGQPIRMLMPEGREDEEEAIFARVRAGEVMNHFETVRRRKDGALLNIALTVAPIYDGEGRIIGVSKIAHDITARVKAELNHLESLIRERNAREEAEILVESARLFSSQIEPEQLAQRLTDLATRLTGAQFGAFFRGITNDPGEPPATYTLSGADKASFAHLPMPIDSPLFRPTFQGGQVVRCGDVRNHPDFGKGRYHGLPPGHAPVHSFLAVPVVSRSGKVHGGLFFAHALCNVFDERAERLVQGIAAQAAIALDNAQAYRDVAESEARFRQMIDALPMPVYTTDPEGVITHFNPASVEFAGRTPEVGKDAWCVSWKLYRADGSFLPHDQCPMAIALKQNRAIFGGIEAMAERPDGTRRWFTPYPTPLHDAHGNLVGGINMLVDISERKRQEQALVDAHARTEGLRRLYEAILDNTPDLAYILDLDRRFTYANAIMLEMLGKTWDEVIGKTPLEIGYPEWHAEMHDREMEQVVATKLPVRGQVPFAGAFGERIYDYIFVPVIGPHGEVEAVAGTTRDVTDQKEIEANLRAEEERKTFLLALGDQLRGLQDPDEVQRAACEALARRLHCDRVYFVEISESEGRAFVLPDYHRSGLPSVAGEYGLAGMEDLLAGLHDGHPLVVDDTGQAPLPQATRTLVESLGIRALAANVLIKRGKLTWALLAAHTRPREWRPDEISLMAEVAERTWDAVQRAQAVDALREAHAQAEQHARTLDSTLSSVRDLVFRLTPEGRFDFVNQAMLDKLGVSREQIIGKSMADNGFSSETAQVFQRDLDRVLQTRAPVEGETPYAGSSSLRGHYAYKLAPIFDAAGDVTLIAGTALDISDRKRNEMLLAEQKNVLELVATGCDLPYCLEELTASVSRLDAHTCGAVLLANENGDAFSEVHSATLPACFGDNVCGAPICRLAIGTCGRAVFEGRPITCSDIATDEQWAPEWRSLCTDQGLHACHSVPIFDPHGTAIGSFFLAFDAPGEPDEWHRRIAEFGAHVASIAIANKRAEAAVRKSEAELAQELADTRLLQGVSTELLSETDPDALYSRIVDAATALMRSDAATLQMLHPERGDGGELRLLAYRGFSDEAARRREWIQVGSDTASGMALQQGKRIIIKDMRECADTLGKEGVTDYERNGIRAMQTTPLFSRSGRLVGMLSTHWHEPHEPSPRRLGLLEVLGRQAADLIESRRAEQKLLELNNFLERRVVERTAELVESERRVRDMASQLTMAEHAERRRISQILHDDLQQQLHSIQMKLASARSALGRGDEARTLRHLTDAEQWSGEGVETARRLTVDLSPPILKSEGLAEALDWLVTQMREMHGLHVVVSGDRDLRMHDDAKRVLIYQIVRELLFNIVKHAGTNRAKVELRRNDETLDVCVLDEGRGFEPDKLRKQGPRKAGGFGLTSAHERLSLLGGSIEVDSAPGIGTAIVLHLPLRHAVGVDSLERVDGERSDTEDLFD
jgi:PAS domain S-box-containing protein